MKVEVIRMPKASFTTEKEREVTQVYAEQLIEELRKKTAQRIPAVSQILSFFPFTSVKEDIEFETDGTQIYYSPKIIVDTSRRGKMLQLQYRYLHILVHGLLGHFQISEEYPADYLLHALMDIEVTEFLDQIGIKDPTKTYHLGQFNKRQGEKGCKEGLLWRYNKVKREKEEKKQIYEKAKTLRQDHYEYWHQKKPFRMVLDVKEQQKEVRPDQLWKWIYGMLEGNAAVSGKRLVELLGASKWDGMQHGLISANEKMLVEAGKRAKLDYRKELSHFFHMRELNREQPAAIDKVLYTLGLQMYGNAVLLEPEEMAEQRAVHTIVLAIDTSGSCMGAVFEQFLAETKELFSMLSENEFHRFIVLQCDAGIKDVKEYRSADQFPRAKEFQDGIQMRGFGGTNFIPVFDYVDELISKKEKVDCLIYLTDGFGTFPEQEKSEYQTFFVMSRADCFFDNSPRVPQWIKQVYLKQEENQNGISVQY